MRKLLIFLTLIPVLAVAKPVTVKVGFDSIGIFIGQQTGFDMVVEQSVDQQIKFPLFSDTIVSGLEIVEPVRYDTTKLSDERIMVDAHYVVTAFDSALVFVPALQFVDADSNIYYSNPISLKVLDMPIDTTQIAICDIKDVVKPPFDWAFFVEMLALALLIVGLCIAIFFIVKKLRKKKSDEPQKEEVDLRPAHVIAYEALEQLQSQQLWQQEKVKEYYTELTDIMRAYLHNRFGIEAMEMTTDQILEQCAAVERLASDRETKNLIAQVLRLADLVKFAKWQPNSNEHTLCFENTTTLVDKTKLEQGEVEQQPVNELIEPQQEPIEPEQDDYSKYMPK